MSVISFKELANSKGDRGRTTMITGQAGDEIDLVPLSFHPHSDGDGYGVLCHLDNDETCTGFVNVFENQLILEGGLSTKLLIKQHMDDGLVLTARMTKTPGQLRLIRGLRFEKA